MSTERPTMETGKLQGSLRAIPDAFRKAIDEVKPDGLDWQRIEAAMDVLTGEKIAVTPKPPEPEPTDSQKFWRKMFETENSPYSEYRPMKKEAFETFVSELTHDFPGAVKNIAHHIHAIDVDIRGGRDPGDIKERAQRMATMLGVFAIFTAFDAGTSRPIHWAQEKWIPKRGDDPTTKWNAGVDMGLKLTEVLNDKLATAYGDKLVSKLTGKKAYFTTEPTDKLADVGNVAFEDWMEDLVNGPNLEAAARFIYQFPIIGAFTEQFISAIARLQGRDGVSKGVGKAMFMAYAKYLYMRRGLGNKGKPPVFKMTDQYMEAYNSI